MKKMLNIRLWRSSHWQPHYQTIDRVPRQHIGWQSVIYKGKRYRLSSGIRTKHFINLDNPIVNRN